MRRNVIATMGLLGLFALTAAPGCAAETEETEDGSGAISKPALRARFADARRIDTRNLSMVVADIGGDALTNALRVRSKYGELGVGIIDTNVFGKVAENNSLVPSSGKVKSLEALRAGLADQLGDKDFPTELAALRLAHLSSGTDKYYVETGFTIRGAIGPKLSHNVGGFGDNDLKLDIGFRKGENVETRVVVAAPDAKLGDLMDASGEAIAVMREGIGGFVIPEDAEQITKMKPGEAFGIRARGTFAANFGVGAPFLIADAGPFAYTVAVSAALSHAVDGVLDVQLVRLGGDEVALDVGISDGEVNERSLGIKGNFGFPELCDDGQKCLDDRAEKIVKKALTKRLREFMKTSIGVSGGENVQRLELARMRFHLNAAESAQALEQALHGDLRYAQALYARSLSDANPPVIFDLDMLRASMTSQRTFGAQLFGMNIFHRTAVERTGSFAVQTPNGVQSVVWDSFKKTSGFFQMDHGSKITALSSASLSAENPDKAVNRANLLVQTVVGDKDMDDDMLLDSTDALIAMLAGKDALAALDKFGTPMQKAVGAECGGRDAETNKETWDEACNIQLLGEEGRKVVTVDGVQYTLSAARAEGVKAFLAQPAVARLPREHQPLLTSAAELRLTLQTVKVRAIGKDGPDVSFALNYRLDDGALSALSKVDEAAFKNAALSYFSVVGGERVGVSGGRSISDRDANKAADEMVKGLQRFKAQYRNVSENETQDLPSLLAGKPFIRLPIGIRFDVSNVANVDSPERMARYVDDTDRIRVESLSHQRALIGKDLYDSVLRGSETGVKYSNFKGRLFSEQAAAYPILAVLPPSKLEVGMDLAADLNSAERFSKAGFKALSVSARGSEVEAITSKLFDIDAMLAAP
jgi:hypothetical protein